MGSYISTSAEDPRIAALEARIHRLESASAISPPTPMKPRKTKPRPPLGPNLHGLLMKELAERRKKIQPST